MNGETVQLIKQLERRIGKLEAQLVRQRFSGAKVYHSISQTLTNDIPTALSFDSEDIDTDSYHSGITNNSRLTAPIDGHYLVIAQAAFVSNAVGDRRLFLVINGSNQVSQNGKAATSGIVTLVNIAYMVTRESGDYIEVQALQNSGGNLGTQPISGRAPYFTITLLS